MEQHTSKPVSSSEAQQGLAEMPSKEPVFLTAIRTTLGRVPLWLITWAVPLVVGFVLAQPFLAWHDSALAHHYEPGSLRAGAAGAEGDLPALSTAFRFDHASDLGDLRANAARTFAPLALIFMLLGVFFAGGWLQVFLERTEGHSVRRFLWGGARTFWRFLRVWVLTLLWLSLISWVFFGMPWERLVLGGLFHLEDGDFEGLSSELTAVYLTWTQAGLHAFFFALVLVWGDYTRTRIAIGNTRSALWAGLATLFLLLRHPIRSLRPFAAILLVEMAVVGGLGWVARTRSAAFDAESGWLQLFLLFAVAQLALIWQSICRASRYHAAVQVSRSIIPPPAQPDPWAHRVGGPGGPQYPIDDEDDYGVMI